MQYVKALLEQHFYQQTVCAEPLLRTPEGSSMLNDALQAALVGGGTRRRGSSDRALFVVGGMLVVGERAGLGMCRQRRHAGREGRRRGVRDSYVARRCREWFARAHSMSVRSPGQSDRARAMHTAHAKVYYSEFDHVPVCC